MSFRCILFYVCVAYSLHSFLSFADPSLLTPAEQNILDTGDIHGDRYFIGGALGILPGFGIGHAIQGRYSERGYIFTTGELISYGVIIVGALSTNDCGSCGRGKSTGGAALTVAGLVGFLTFKIWEAVDVWQVGSHNRRVQELKKRIGETSDEPRSSRIEPFLIPTGTDGGLAGLAIHF